MSSAVFARAAATVEVNDVLAEFKIIVGAGTLHGLINCKYVIIGNMVYAEGYCPENNQMVGGYKTSRPDDGSNLRELGFTWDSNLDAPAIEVRGHRPQL